MSDGGRLTKTREFVEHDEHLARQRRRWRQGAGVEVDEELQHQGEERGCAPDCQD